MLGPLLGAVASGVALALLLRRPAPPPPPRVERAGPPATVIAPAGDASAVPTTAPRPVGSGPVRDGPPAMQHLDARRTNRSPFVAPGRPRVLWTYAAGEAIAVAPVVSGDRAIVATLGGRLAAVGLDGRPRWALELGARIYGSPLVVRDTVYAGLDEGHVVAVDASKGTVRWKLDVAGDADTALAPTPDGGLVFAAKNVVHAVRADGTVRWRHKHRRKVFGAPAVADDGTIVVGAQDGAVLALAPDGALKWRATLGRDADAGLAIGDDGAVYAGTDGGDVVALAPADGSIRWRAALGGFVRGPLSVGRDGAVLASTYGPAPAVVALDGASGRVLWRFGVRGTGAREFGVHGAPLEDPAGTLVFGAQDDTLYALHPDGTLAWKLRLGGDVDATVALAADRLLLVGGGDGLLVALGE
ncbi:MAG: hypothetical protein EOO75_06350 [Myxococcales bacterium]|nr:MAG: hypothetical protein EOO75_06350 [Myxococcales bacterium]